MIFFNKLANAGIGEIVRMMSNFDKDYGQILQIAEDLCLIQEAFCLTTLLAKELHRLPSQLIDELIVKKELNHDSQTTD